MHDIARTSCVKAPPIANGGFSQRGLDSLPDAIPHYQLVRLPLLPSLHPGSLHSRAAMRRSSTAVLRWCSLIANRGYATAQQPQKTGGLRNVRHVIAVASGKGGVGKSTAAGARGGTLGACMSARTLGSEPLTPSRPCDR